MKKQSPINIRECLILIIFLIAPLFVKAQDTNENKSGKGPVNLMAGGNSCSLNISLRVQPQFTSDCDLPEVQTIVNYSDRKFNDGFLYKQ